MQINFTYKLEIHSFQFQAMSITKYKSTQNKLHQTTYNKRLLDQTAKYESVSLSIDEEPPYNLSAWKHSQKNSILEQTPR
jgi:hypothetical protein